MSGNSDPRNPYQSHVVKASAGCGKTFQLSQRFLALVAAGAEPSTILTVTFTRKAAAEMRERILGDAGKLLSDGLESHVFDREMAAFYDASKKEILSERGIRLPPPRSAKDAGSLIINQSQSLRITTIDSVFHDWIAKFPAETGLATPAGSPLSLAGDLDLLTMEQSAWESANRELLTKFAGETADSDEVGEAGGADPSNVPGDAGEETNPKSTVELAKELSRHSSFLWHLEQSGQTSWLMNPQGENPEVLKKRVLLDLKSSWDALAGVIKKERGDELRRLTSATGPDDAIAALIAAKFITGKMTINGATFRESTTASVASDRQLISEGLQEWDTALKIRALRQKAERASTLFTLYYSALRSAKQKAGVVSFDDLLSGSSKIFSDPYAAGARYLLQKNIRHLMLDEFQDTSWPQWNIFNEITNEVLSGADEIIPGTVFLVGDEKQSIYSFRNSDPEIMGMAGSELAHQGVLESPLNHSFRTCKTILDFLNRACGKMPDFPDHAPACIDGKLVNPDIGSVAILPVAENETAVDGAEANPLNTKDLETIEASGLACWLKCALDGSPAHPVFDKVAGAWRPIEPKDCAILFRSKERMWTVERALQKEGIPAIREESGNIFGHQEIKDCMELMRFLARPGDLNALLGVLKSPFIGASDEILAQALTATNENQRHSPLRALNVLHELEGGAPSASSILPLAWLSEHLKMAGKSRPSVLMESCLKASEYCIRSRSGRSAVESEVLDSHLSDFLNLVRTLESNCDNNLHAVGATLRRMARIENLPTPGGESPQGVNAVRLMTVHKAKGLEFPLVAIVDTAAPWVTEPRGWLKITDPEAPGMIYLGAKSRRPVNDLATDRFLELALASEVAEANRVWYVALTRARQYLVLSGTRRRDKVSLIDALQRLSGAPLTSHELCALAVQDFDDSTSAPYTIRVLIPLQSGMVDGSATPVLKGHALVLESSGLKDMRKGFRHIVPTCEPAPNPTAQREEPVLSVKPLPLPFGVKILVASRFSEKKPLPQIQAMSETEIMPEKPGKSGALQGRLAAAVGSMVHAGLEHAVRQISFSPNTIWQEICDKNLLDDLSPDVQLGRQQSLQQLAAVLGSSIWTELLARYPRHRAEVPVVLLDEKRNLNSGTIDLLLDDGTDTVDPGSIMVVDFKTSLVEGDPAQHARESGYFDQVRSYTGTLKQAFPGAKIAGCILYTRLLHIIQVPH